MEPLPRLPGVLLALALTVVMQVIGQRVLGGAAVNGSLERSPAARAIRDHPREAAWRAPECRASSSHLRGPGDADP